uniref:tRNA (N6-isopentenyl adenosine(37)-C2)-methylthiotransferase MiaB n=1 Tax=Gemmiger formicilis TaxID=745368 RepID=UPI00402537C0
MNKHDSERVAGMLEGLGSLPVETIEEADIVVFMTCCVREAADTRLYGQVASMKNIPLRDGTPLDKRYIAVGGCIGQRDGDKLLAALPHLDVVFGTHNLGSLPGLLRRAIEQHGRAAEVIEGGAEFSSALPTVREHDWAAWLPITVGCNNFCSYCIVPYVRGRERSREPAAILAEFRQLVEQGYKEITLLGQNVNSYGKGLEHPIDFADLLNLLCEVPGDYQIRFMTSHPKDASRKLIDTIAAQEHLCKHIHLPVQSGSDRLLKEMNRHYNVAQYMDLIRYAKEKIPGVTFSSDIIVGFPGETEEDFAATLDLIREVGYMQLFTFIYSKRAGTPAAKLPDPTTHAEKAARMDRLLKTQEEFAFAATAAMAGRTVRVLVEAAGRNEGTVNGRLDNNLVVEFKAPESLIGQWADVHITGSRAALLVGELAE